MAKATRQKAEEGVTLQHRISAFLIKQRLVIIGIIVALFVIIGALVAITVIADGKRDAAFSKIESLVGQWNDAKSAESADLAATEDGIIAELDKVAAGNRRSFAGARAGMAAAEIYFSRKDWKNAEERYTAAVKAAPEAYTAGISLYNASVCADELGNWDAAVGYIEKALALETFPLKTRALFNMARILEASGQNDKAIAAYERLTGDFAEDEWTLLGKSRLIELNLNK